MENLKLIDCFFEAYGSRNLEALKGVVGEDFIWSFPGRNPLSGIKRGISEVVGFFDAMGKIMGDSNITVEKLVMGANDDYVLECQHVKSNRQDGIDLDHQWCVLWRFKEGKITEGKHFAADQYHADHFFNQIYHNK